MDINFFILTFVEPKNNNMKFYNTFKKGDGSYKTIEYSAQEMLNIDIISFLIIGSICALLSTFASLVLVFVTLHDYEEEGVKPSIWGVLIGGYFLIDVYNHWLIWIFLRFLESEKWIAIIFNLNIAYLVTHVFLIIFGATFYYNVEERSERKAVLTVTTIAVLVASFLLAWAIN